jgi:hypothetical protein
MLKPWPKKMASPALRFGAIDSALGVRRQDHDQVGLGRRLRGRHDAQALVGGLRPALRPLGQADPHVDAGVAQRERVRVPLAAVPDHRDLAALDDRQIGVVVVVDVDTHDEGCVLSEKSEDV